MPYGDAVEAVVWAKQVDKESIPKVGGKGANLGEMLKSDLPIPQAFIITSEAFQHFLEEGGIKQRILEILSDVDYNNPDDLKEKSDLIKEIIMNTEMPWEIEVAITNAYNKLSHDSGVNEEFVAVRSSATAEDLPEASFAGQQETFLNVLGEKRLLDAVKKCWASLYTPRAIFYREQQSFKHADVSLAVVVQKMVDSDISGVMFTADPVSGEAEIQIEAGYGLGEYVVAGKITPDIYRVDRNTLEIKDKEIKIQSKKLIRNDDGKNEEVEVSTEFQGRQKLSNELIKKVAELGKKIHEHYNEPMDVEWCVENGQVYIVQARPVTTIKERGEERGETFEGKVLTKGLPASPGIGAGKVAKISSISELSKVKEGNVLVTVMTNPDMVPAMIKANAIVTDEGGTTCHAAIVSREFGIPCVVGTGDATKVLNDGMEVTVEVDSKVGTVYEGIKDVEEVKEEMVVTDTLPTTATKILINLGIPDVAEERAKLPVQGIGLMREEFIAGTYIKIHPNALLEYEELKKDPEYAETIKKIDELTEGYDDKAQYFIDKLAEGIAKVCRAFSPRPVVLRTSDFKTNEYRELIGGQKYEPHEDNPMIGWRGCSRYVTKEFEDAFRLELKAIKKVREEMGLKNLWVMLPFVRTVEEAKHIIEMMKEEGLERGKDFKIWIMAEVPSNVILADEFSKICDGFSIGSNDLTQLVMGADRDSTILEQMGYFDERNPAVTRSIEQLIKIAHEHGCTVSICGQAPSKYPEFCEFLVRNGIDSISLNADVVVETIKLVASIEQKVIMERLKKLEEKNLT